MSTPKMDWNDYRFFLAVAETGSLSAAARRLRVAQPTVGRRLQALETRLDTRLFERVGYRYSLTTVGENIRSLVLEMERETLTIERRVASLDGRLSGAVRIATTENLAEFWLAPKLFRLRALYPELTVELITGTTMADLLRREADLALRVGDPGESNEDLASRQIGSTHCGLYAAPAYLARYGVPQSLAELSDHAIIESIGEIAGLRQAQLLRTFGARIALQCNNIGVQLAAARAGFGVLSLTDYMAAAERALIRVLPEAFDLALGMWLVTHRELRSTARIEALADFLSQQVRQDGALFSAAE